MLLKVKIKEQKIEKYKDIISHSLFSDITKKSKKLKGLRVVHINSTPRGGGVAEVSKGLSRKIPNASLSKRLLRSF